MGKENYVCLKRKAQNKTNGELYNVSKEPAEYQITERRSQHSSLLTMAVKTQMDSVQPSISDGLLHHSRTVTVWNRPLVTSSK